MLGKCNKTGATANVNSCLPFSRFIHDYNLTKAGDRNHHFMWSIIRKRIMLFIESWIGVLLINIDAIAGMPH